MPKNHGGKRPGAGRRKSGRTERITIMLSPESATWLDKQPNKSVAVDELIKEDFMKVLNLTPHPIHVYSFDQFKNLEQSNPTTWLADGVEGDPIAEYPSHGVARIATKTETVKSLLPGESVRTAYGEATGIPALEGNETLIVSLPMQSMARQAKLVSAQQMVAPYKVVRLRSNPSQVLGCMGFTY